MVTLRHHQSPTINLYFRVDSHLATVVVHSKSRVSTFVDDKLQKLSARSPLLQICIWGEEGAEETRIEVS